MLRSQFLLTDKLGISTNIDIFVYMLVYISTIPICGDLIIHVLLSLCILKFLNLRFFSFVG